MRTQLIVGMTLLLALAPVACSREPQMVETTRIVKETVVEEKVETIVETVVETVVGKQTVVELMAEPTEAAALMSNSQSQSSGRLIIKEARLVLHVQDTGQAIDDITQLVGDLGGYVIRQRVWYEGENKFASLSIAVPVQAFEKAQGRLRGLALRVLDETASGEDVTAQYVDTESRLRNLEATRDRIRSFLDQAQAVEEALAVNRELSNIESQIEQTKGRLNYLQGRTTFSTIHIELDPVPSSTTSQSQGWQLDETFQEATTQLGSIVEGLVKLFIWGTIVLGPFALVAALLLWLFKKLSRSRKRKVAAATSGAETGGEQAPD